VTVKISRRVACLLVAAACCGCDSEPGSGPLRPVPSGPGGGILFVGNSLTFANDLPGLVQGLSAASGGRLLTASVTFGGYSLEDHLRTGDAARSIATRGWRVVVLQQGPSSLEESRRLLRLDTATFDRQIRAAGARTALYSVWAESTRLSAFPDVAESYWLAAQDVGGIYFPVTDAWLLAWERDPSLDLYSSDGFHPSELASYLAALVIVAVLDARSPVGMPARVARPDGSAVSIPATTAALLQDAAARAVAKYPPSQ
jgi:hypothetical protein